jgi:hypothetical protein
MMPFQIKLDKIQIKLDKIQIIFISNIYLNSNDHIYDAISN